MPLDQAVLDYQPLDIVDTATGARASACCSSPPAATWSSGCCTAVRDAGLRPEGIDLSAFAMIRALRRPGAAATTPIALPVGRRPDEPRGRQGRPASSPARRRRPRDASPSSSPSAAPDARARARLARARRPRAAARDGRRASATSSRRPAQVLCDGVRRIAAEVRNSLDFHRMQGADGSVAARGPDRAGRRGARLRRGALRRSRPARRDRGRRRRARPASTAPASPSPPAWRSRRLPRHEGRQPHPRRGAPRRRCAPAAAVAPSTRLLGALALLVVLRHGRLHHRRSVSSKQDQLAVVTAAGAGRRVAGRRRSRPTRQFATLREKRVSRPSPARRDPLRLGPRLHELSRTLPAGHVADRAARDRVAERERSRAAPSRPAARVAAQPGARAQRLRDQPGAASPRSLPRCAAWTASSASRCPPSETERRGKGGSDAERRQRRLPRRLDQALRSSP